MLRFSIISKLSPNLITLYTTASEEWRTASNVSKIKPRQLDFKDKISIRSPLIVVLLVSRSYFHCVEVKPSQFNLEEKETLIMY